MSYLPSSGDQFSSLTTITQQVKPEKFTNREIGAKWEINPQFSATVAVYRLDLSRGEFHLLSALAAGETLGKALRLASRRAGKPLSPAAVRKAFRLWTSEGILR